MLKVFKKFFDFCGKKNRNKFYKSLILGVLFGLMEAMKIPAIMLMIDGALRNNVTPGLILKCFGIILASVIVGSVVKYYITILQCEAGYYTASNKRIQIAEHMRYLPMGYFNKNSLGQITSVVTNTMEQLADVSTGVVMMTLQGIFATAVITLFILCYDWRIGLVAVAGIILFFAVNSFLQKRSQKLAPIKTESDTDVVAKVLEYVQGISEVRSYNLTAGKYGAIKLYWYDHLLLPGT